MEAVGLGVGVLSIASLFQTCLHGYRSLNTAMAIGDAALTLSIQFRVEELRLYMWGRNWGLTKDLQLTGEDAESTAEGVEPGRSQVLGNEDDPPGTSLQHPQTSFDSADDELEIPGLRDLTIDVLGRIQKALEEWKTIGKRYGAAPSDGKTSTSSQASTSALIKTVGSKQSTQSQEISSRTKLSSKLRWAMTDKGILEEILVKLTNFNDSLEKLLPKRERTSLARGLAAELLTLLENATNVTAQDVSDRMSQLGTLDEVKAARIVSIKHMNKTETGERQPEQYDEAKSETAEDSLKHRPTPFAKSAVWSDGEHEDMLIPAEHFLRLAEPKIQYYHVHQKGRWVSSSYSPLPRSIAVLSPPESDVPAIKTLIEWRPAAHESSASQLTNAELKERRDHIARLLHRTSVTDTDFRVLDCLGYTTSKAHTPDGSTHGVVGYVYQYPDFAAATSPPVALRDLLGEAYHSDNPEVPSLEARFRLARNLSIALYQLQCAGWVHRKISSYNVIFFRDRETGAVNLKQPYLVGWQYSRPDDQRKFFPSERASPGIADLDMYLHRFRLDIDYGKPLPRYRKSYDIYSLGIILIEIAFWEPILSLAAEVDRKKMEKWEKVNSSSLAAEWWERIRKTVEVEIAPEMGEAYRDAVLFCLKGPAGGIQTDEERKAAAEKVIHSFERGDPEAAYYEDIGFEEIGIEREFYWKVLKALDRFGL